MLKPPKNQQETLCKIYLIWSYFCLFLFLIPRFISFVQFNVLSFYLFLVFFIFCIFFYLLFFRTYWFYFSGLRRNRIGFKHLPKSVQTSCEPFCFKNQSPGGLLQNKCFKKFCKIHIAASKQKKALYVLYRTPFCDCFWLVIRCFSI